MTPLALSEAVEQASPLRGDMNNRVLTICATDGMAWVLLRSYLNGLRNEGFDVHVACAEGDYTERLRGDGFVIHPVPFRRSFNPFVHIMPLVRTLRLCRSLKPKMVNTHSPVAAAVGRVAAWLAGTRRVTYVVHGFYFHENMPRIAREACVAIEWVLGRVTDNFIFVSDEDRQTAIRCGIVSGSQRATTIFNGVDTQQFRPKTEAEAEEALQWKVRHSLSDEIRIVGIVGRIVKEKGYVEFLEMARGLAGRSRDVAFLVVGDSLPSDRDQFSGPFKHLVGEYGLQNRFIFSGMTDNVPKYLRLMDVFVLPSYREGFPRSVLEAMGVGLPVVATNIRGCREAIAAGITGLLVPPKDSDALIEAVASLLDCPDTAASMGEAGRQRVLERFDMRLVQRSFVNAVLSGADPSDQKPC